MYRIEIEVINNNNCMPAVNLKNKKSSCVTDKTTL